MSRRLIPIACALVCAVACHPDPNRGTVELIGVPTPSLADSALPNPAALTTLVYLPPGHETGRRRYPVIYYLPGFTTDPTEYVDQTFQGFHLRVTMDTLIKLHRIKPMIVVIPTGRNELGGSFWVDSPVTGSWARSVVDDVIPYVDRRFSTRAEPDSRGVAGDSMGGFGALHLAMTRPGVFSAVYALSPGLFADARPVDDWMFGDDRRVEADLELVAELAKLDRKGASRTLREAVEALYSEGDRDSYFRAFNLAYGAAFAPTAGGLPPLINYPFAATPAGNRSIADRRMQWVSGFGGLEGKVAASSPDLRRLRGLVIDYGRNDSLEWIPEGCERLSELLTAAGVQHEVRAHQGSHVGSLRWRIEYEMLPFFSQLLAGASEHGTGAESRAPSLESR